jgi:hypothetical protein
MGGYGSGRWYRWSTKDTVDGNRYIDVRRWYREDKLCPGLWFSWCWCDRETGEKKASINVRTHLDLVVLSYRSRKPGEEWKDVAESIRLTWTSCNYGGRRPWFVCPGVVNGVPCQRRVAVLYGTGDYFLCRHCYGLAYESQRENRAYRALRRANKIRERLGGHAGMALPFLSKPKGMRWETYYRLHREADEAEYESLLAMVERLS